MNPADLDIANLAHFIQLSVAPVFLISGIGALLGVIAGRLARVIDRARAVEASWATLGPAEQEAARAELAMLARRARVSNRAINSAATSALLVCLVIATLFIDAMIGTRLRWFVAALFILSMAGLMAAVAFFLHEVHLATHSLRIGPPPIG